MNIDTLSEKEAEAKLRTLFSTMQDEGVLKKYDLVLVERKAKEQSTSYFVSFVVQVANSFPYEAVRRAVEFCRNDACSFIFDGTHKEWRETKFEIMSISVEVTIQQ